MSDPIWDYLVMGRGARLPGHAKDHLISQRDEILRLRAGIDRAGAYALQGASCEMIGQVLAEVLSGDER